MPLCKLLQVSWLFIVLVMIWCGITLTFGLHFAVTLQLPGKIRLIQSVSHVRDSCRKSKHISIDVFREDSVFALLIRPPLTSLLDANAVLSPGIFQTSAQNQTNPTAAPAGMSI